MNNFDKQTEEICALLRNGVSAEEIATNLSSALQAAEKQFAEETAAKKTKEESAEKLCTYLRNYIDCVHEKTYIDTITDDELIKLVDSAIKGTTIAYKLCDNLGFGDKITKNSDWKESNWEKTFGDFFDKYNL